MKKILSLSLLFVLFSILILAGIASAVDKEQVVIWYYWETELHQQALNRIITSFNHSQDKIAVTAKYVPFADFKKQLSIGAAVAELPDLAIIDNPDHASYAAMGIFADITEKLKGWEGLDNYYEGPLNSTKLDGRLYGLPFGSNCIALYYNEDMLKEAGAKVPTTWDELVETARLTTRGNVKGFAMSSLQNEEGTFNLLPWVWSAGATAYDINNPAGIKALSYLHKLVSNGYMSEEAINWTQGDVMHQFISENVAMMFNGPWQIPTMKKQAPDLNWKVTLIPKDKEYASDLGGENFGIINGNHIDATIEFVKYAADPEVMMTYINDFGYIASRQDVAAQQFAEDDKVMQLFTKEMDYARPRGPHPDWPEISNALSSAMVKSMLGVATPEEAAAEAQNTIDEVLNK